MVRQLRVCMMNMKRRTCVLKTDSGASKKKITEHDAVYWLGDVVVRVIEEEMDQVRRLEELEKENATSRERLSQESGRRIGI